ncbi:MAG: hypothetical protein JNM51_05350, partial [Bacteroidia bacterium]|nr:hypothetical protein [Bacteroidia bacterium]
MKSIFTTILAVLLSLSNTLSLKAQTIPAYVPVNGLVGWWPFNGNANDESGNGHNATVNGAVLTIDRYGNNNNAYDCNPGYLVSSSTNGIPRNGPMSISVWFNAT